MKVENYNSDLIDKICNSISPRQYRKIRRKMVLQAKFEDLTKYLKDMKKGWIIFWTIAGLIFVFSVVKVIIENHIDY